MAISGGGGGGGGGDRSYAARADRRAAESATRKEEGEGIVGERMGNGGPAPTTLRYDSPGVANRA